MGLALWKFSKKWRVRPVRSKIPAHIAEKHLRIRKEAKAAKVRASSAKLRRPLLLRQVQRWRERRLRIENKRLVICVAFWASANDVILRNVYKVDAENA